MILCNTFKRFRHRRLTELSPRNRTLLNALALPIVVTKRRACREQRNQEVVRTVLLQPEDEVVVEASLGEILRLHALLESALVVVLRLHRLGNLYDLVARSQRLCV